MSRTIKNNPSYHYVRHFRTYPTKRDELHAYLELIEAEYKPNNRFKVRANPKNHINTWDEVFFAVYPSLSFRHQKTKIEKAVEKVRSINNIWLYELFISLKKHGYNLEIR